MKNLTLALALMALFVYGCSERINPVEPSQTARIEGSSTVAKLAAASTMLSGSEAPAPPTSTNSVSQPIRASVGGNVCLKGAYLGKYGDTVSYDVSVTIPPGALPYSTSISISIDQSTFADDGTLTFGPSGIVFNTPLQLSVHATNIAFVKKNETVNFYYLNNGVMESMPASWGVITKKGKSNTIDASALVPHFSRYAFGR